MIGYTKHRGGGETKQGITYKTQRRWGYKAEREYNTEDRGVGLRDKEAIRYRTQWRWGCKKKGGKIKNTIKSMWVCDTERG